jgi:hypothetical protein
MEPPFSPTYPKCTQLKILNMESISVLELYYTQFLISADLEIWLYSVPSHERPADNVLLLEISNLKLHTASNKSENVCHGLDKLWKWNVCVCVNIVMNDRALRAVKKLYIRLCAARDSF